MDLCESKGGNLAVGMLVGSARGSWCLEALVGWKASTVSPWGCAMDEVSDGTDHISFPPEGTAPPRQGCSPWEIMVENHV